MGTMTQCGCGKHHVRIGVRSTVAFRGEHWDAACAFEAVTSEGEPATKSPTRDQLLRIVQHVPCFLCEKPVGRNMEVFGDNVYHPTCLHDVGGEG